MFVADAKESKARFVPVTPGIIDGETAEIVEPQITGQVVTMGNHLLEDSSSIVLPTGKGPQGAKAPAETTANGQDIESPGAAQ